MIRFIGIAGLALISAVVVAAGHDDRPAADHQSSTPAGPRRSFVRRRAVRCRRTRLF